MVFVGKKLGKLLSLVCIEIVLIRHFLGGLMADRDIQIGSCNGGRCFHNIPVAVVGFGNHFLGLCFGAGRYFIHLPENIF